jgi:alpha-beta hydrolase superfamily lysophospholipase
MYMTPLCWDQWVDYFSHRGFTCLAPAWPGRDQPVATLWARNPDAALGKLTLTAVLESLARTIQNLDVKPILIGHSMGGLLVQLLLQKDLAAAGVAIDSAPPQGVFTTSWSFLKSNWPHINPFAPQDQPIVMTFERFQYTFVNSLPEKEQREAFDTFVVPESRRVPAESLAAAAHVDFHKAHAPLLLVAGSADHIIPASLNRTNYARYNNGSGSVTDFKEFPGRTHFIIGQGQWEEVASYIQTWIAQKV